jgi:integrase
MQSPLESKDREESTRTSPSSYLLEGSTVSTVEFIENCFIPNHVALKTQAGRTHYHAILKHVLRPETVDRLLLPYRRISRSKLKSVPGWPYLDETRLCDIGPDHVRRLTSLAANHGYSPQTVKHIKNVVSAIISHAKKERVLSGDNPIAEVRLPPIARKASHPISLADARAIFRMMEYPERQIALIMFNSTMNVSEVCGLQWTQINLTSRTVFVEGKTIPPRSISIKCQRTSSGIVPVTSDRVRTIEMSTPLLNVFNALKRRQTGRMSGDFLFSNSSGISVSPTSILASRLKPIGRRFGINFSWHTLKEVHDAFLQDLCLRLNSELAAL